MVLGRRDYLMDSVKQLMKEENISREIFTKERDMEKVFINLKSILMMEIGIMDRWMDMEKLLGLMEEVIKELFLKISSMDQESTLIEMVKFTQDHLEMERNTEKVKSTFQIRESTKEYGKTIKKLVQRHFRVIWVMYL